MSHVRYCCCYSCLLRNNFKSNPYLSKLKHAKITWYYCCSGRCWRWEARRWSCWTTISLAAVYSPNVWSCWRRSNSDAAASTSSRSRHLDQLVVLCAAWCVCGPAWPIDCGWAHRETWFRQFRSWLYLQCRTGCRTNWRWNCNFKSRHLSFSANKIVCQSLVITWRRSWSCLWARNRCLKCPDCWVKRADSDDGCLGNLWAH